MFETILVVAIVAAAAAYSIRNFIKKVNGEAGCSCSSGTCDKTAECCASRNISQIQECPSVKKE